MRITLSKWEGHRAALSYSLVCLRHPKRWKKRVKISASTQVCWSKWPWRMQNGSFRGQCILASCNPKRGYFLPHNYLDLSLRLLSGEEMLLFNAQLEIVYPLIDSFYCLIFPTASCTILYSKSLLHQRDRYKAESDVLCCPIMPVFIETNYSALLY